MSRQDTPHLQADTHTSKAILIKPLRIIEKVYRTNLLTIAKYVLLVRNEYARRHFMIPWKKKSPKRTWEQTGIKLFNFAKIIQSSI